MRSTRIMNAILQVGAISIFVGAEILVLIALRDMPREDKLPSIGARCFIGFVTALPMVAGINGYYSVRRRRQNISTEVIDVLSMQFLIAIIAAYATLITCIGPTASVITALRNR